MSESPHGVGKRPGNDLRGTGRYPRNQQVVIMRALRHLVGPVAAALALTTVVSTGALAGRPPIALGLTISPEWGTSGAWWNRELETIGGRDPAIMSMVFAWNGPATARSQDTLNEFVSQPTAFPSRAVLDKVYSRGAIPLLMWQPNLRGGETLQTILDGRYDDYIRSWARAAAEDGRPMILRFAQEMNARSFPWGATRTGNTPQDFIAVWQKVFDAFRGPDGAGATNVRFMWAPIIKQSGHASFESVWPGNAYVHYIGLDGYNWYDHRGADGRWRSMREIFTRSLELIAERWPAKPVVIAEVGSVADRPDDPYDKGRWLRRGLTFLHDEHPQVVGLVYFNIKVIGSEGDVNWRLDTSDSSLQSYRELTRDARFSGSLEPDG